MSESEFTVLLPSKSNWSYSAGIAQRKILVEELDDDNSSENITEHLELNTYAIYKTGENSNTSLGILYRFREMFDPENENMFRILQQYYFEKNNNFLGMWHRPRFEQRFSTTRKIFRFRYEFGLSKAVSKDIVLELSTEALYSVSKQSKPHPEQRIAFNIINNTLQIWDFNLGVEYRLDNYILEQQNNLFILAGGKISL